jgi:hypothetical protein
MANEIRAKFPHVKVQGKGLLATEAPITVPLVEANGCVPLVNDVFLEFEGIDDTATNHSMTTGGPTTDGKTTDEPTTDRMTIAGGARKLLHELKDGQRYQLIVSQSAGLTRYRLGDLVEVRGCYKKAPKLVFVGRATNVCDLVGEKLHEHFVRSALSPLLPSSRFLLVPANPWGYTLLIEQAVRFTDGELDLLVEQADAALCQAHHYHQARCLDQLQIVQLLVVPNLLQVMQTFYQSEGVKLGSIKHAALIADPAKAGRLLSFISAGQHTFSPLPARSSAQNIPAPPARLQAIQVRADA